MALIVVAVSGCQPVTGGVLVSMAVSTDLSLQQVGCDVQVTAGQTNAQLRTAVANRVRQVVQETFNYTIIGADTIYVFGGAV